MVDPDGNTWTYTYDSYGDKTSQTAPATSDQTDVSGSYQDVTRWAYDTDTGWVTAQLSGRYMLAHPTATTCTTPATGCTTYTYNDAGQALVTSDGNGNTTTNTYDADGNLSTVTDGDSNETLYAYDAAEEQTSVTKGYGTSDAATSSTSYFGDGTIETQTSPSGAVTQYSYDPLGHLTSVTDPDSRATGYQYDADGNLLVKSDPGISGCTVTSTTDGCTIDSHNADNELTGVDYNDSHTPNVTYGYDPNGRQTSMTDGTGTSTWAYDSLGRLTSEESGSGSTSTVTYGYDAEGNQTSIGYPDSAGTVNKSYDAQGREYSLEDLQSHTTTFTYDADGDLTSGTDPTTGTSVIDSYTYDPADVLTTSPGTPTIAVTKGSTSIATFQYGRDADNQVTSVNSTGVPSDNHTYGYNSLNQLASIDSSNYAYDTAADPTGLANAISQTFDQADQLVTGSGPTPASTQAFTYNPKGQQTLAESGSGGSTAYGYNQAGQLDSATATPPAGTYANVVNASSPAGYWRLDEAAGTAAVDSSGNGLTGTYHGSPSLGQTGAINGDPATSTGFNGTSQYVSLPTSFANDFSGTASFTVEAWVKPSVGSGDTNHRAIATVLQDPVAGESGWEVSLHSGQIQFKRWDDGTSTTVTSPGTISTTAFTQVVAKYNGSTMMLWLNGQQVATASSSLSIPSLTSSPSVLIGSGLQQDFAGDIQDASVYTNNLGGTTINRHYQAGANPPSPYAAQVLADNPVGYWRLGEASGTTANDISGNADNGVYSGGVTLGVTGALDGESATAATFNGTSGAVGIPDSTALRLNGNFSIEFWAKQDSFVGTKPVVIAKGGGGSIGNGYAIYAVSDGSGQYSLTLKRDNVTYSTNNNSLSTGSAYTYFVVTYDGSHVRWYVNGSLQTTTAASFATDTNAGNVEIGTMGTSNYANDTIEDVALYSTTLTSTQISNDYTIGTTIPTGTLDATYTYDGDGLRTSKTVNGTTTNFIYDTTSPTPEIIYDGTNYYIYGPDNLPLEQISTGGTALWYHHDQNGSTRVLTNNTGTVVGTATYTPYGQLAAYTGIIAALGYDGAFTDTETGYLYLINRYYVPTTAEFLTVDPIVSRTQEPYSYADDNPVNGSDPSGLSPCLPGGPCGSFQYLESLPLASCSSSTGSSPGGGFDFANAAILGTAIEGSGFSSVSSYFNAAEGYEHLDPEGYYANALRAVELSNAARGLAVVGAGITIYSDLSQNKSALYTIGDTLGSGFGGAIGGAVGSAICGGPGTGIGVVCGFIGGSIGGAVGGAAGSYLGNLFETDIHDLAGIL
jgi:RHS repeat-associated protein